MKKYLILAGWAILPIAFAARVEHAADTARILPFAGAVLVAPFIEELVKFLSYLGLGKKNTLIVPIAAVMYEAMAAAFNPFTGTADLIGYLLQSAASLAMLKHVLFWIPAKLFNFKWYAYPLAVLLHSLWNLYMNISFPDDGFLAAIIGIASLGLALVLFKEQREK